MEMMDIVQIHTHYSYQNLTVVSMMETVPDRLG